VTAMAAPTTKAHAAADTAANSRPMGWLARIGLTARGVVYLVMGWLAVLVAMGGRGRIDQRGALTKVLVQPDGSALVWLMAFGFGAYALWRLSEALFGVTGDGKKAGPRLKSLARGGAYLVLTYSAVSLLNGARSTQAGQQSKIAQTTMLHSGGRWVVGVVGLVVVVAGLIMVREGWSAKFIRYFGSLPTGLRRPVILLGRVGTISRGIVFAVTGLLVVDAGWTAQPAKASGIDLAFRTLLAHQYGPFLVIVLGIGLMVFGVYGLTEAAWRRVTDSDRS
jgi:hypothetical protein